MQKCVDYTLTFTHHLDMFLQGGAYRVSYYVWRYREGFVRTIHQHGQQDASRLVGQQRAQCVE